MKTATLKTIMVRAFLAVILALGLLIGVPGYYQLKYNVLKRAQIVVTNDLKFARSVYQNEITDMRRSFRLVSSHALGVVSQKEVHTAGSLNELKEKIGLDYLYFIPEDAMAAVKSEIAKRAAKQGGEACGTRIVGNQELAAMGKDLYERSLINVKPTPKSRPNTIKVLDRALAIEYAMPLDKGILYGGRIINRDFELVDRIHNFIFDDKLYGGKPNGTVTIFLDDVRITTNVLDHEGKRAVGTRVSENVYDNVVIKGMTWLDRAFVVTDWYISGYEPIRNINGNIIGILYVGILERPFNDMFRNIILVFVLILSSAIVLAVILSVLMAQHIMKPVTAMLVATEKISGGELDHRLHNGKAVRELGRLAASFNNMAQALYEREQGLKIVNEKLAALNKSYIDMLGFVSHELKGILGSIVMNVYSVKDGYMGALSEKQQKAINAAAKSLDHFEGVVKNYLDLSRIERGKLEVFPGAFLLSEDIVRPTVEHFEKIAAQKKMRIENTVPPAMKITADKNLLSIVCNNLIGNAVKYGREEGLIRIGAARDAHSLTMTFYNDGTPISGEDKELLFRRFSRLPGAGRVKGTGLGLFIVKEIIEKHGGTVHVQASGHGNEFVLTVPQ
ncbi:MAG: cache domain-containing protein [Candidatus Omnitrophica bacterium]|nr:cache domain-containing protein [Candidatus Omnitrophota bacterium]